MNKQERSPVGELAEQMQQITGGTGDADSAAADKHSIKLEIVKHTEAKRGFALMLKRWVVLRTFGWHGGFHHRARDFERQFETLMHDYCLAFLGLLLVRLGLKSTKQALRTTRK